MWGWLRVCVCLSTSAGLHTTTSVHTGWLQLLARRASSRLPARARAFLKLARDQADAAVQSKVDLFLIKRDLDDWISAKRKKNEEARVSKPPPPKLHKSN